MSLTLYGTSRSRTFRVLWMLEELGLPFEHRPISWKTSAKDPEYLAVNPAGTIPCLVDDGFMVAESLAINLYLARKQRDLWFETVEDETRALQWSLWAATSLDEPYEQWSTQAIWIPPAVRKADRIEKAAAALARPLARLAEGLRGRDWLVGEAFSVADLNVASVITMLREFGGLPAEVREWLARCQARPAFAAATARP